MLHENLSSWLFHLFPFLWLFCSYFCMMTNVELFNCSTSFKWWVCLIARFTQDKTKQNHYQPFYYSYMKSCIFNNKCIDAVFFCFYLGVAGCCAKTTIAPLDRIKILLQAQNPHYKHLGKNKTWKANKCLFLHICATWGKLWSIFAGVWSTLKAVPKKEGFLGLYKGNGAMMVRIFPYGAIQFMSFDKYKKVQLQYILYCGIILSKRNVIIITGS